jgi:hypothetical protein
MFDSQYTLQYKIRTHLSPHKAKLLFVPAIMSLVHQLDYSNPRCAEIFQHVVDGFASLPVLRKIDLVSELLRRSVHDEWNLCFHCHDPGHILDVCLLPLPTLYFVH